jgi:hypothetical protein
VLAIPLQNTIVIIPPTGKGNAPAAWAERLVAFVFFDVSFNLLISVFAQITNNNFQKFNKILSASQHYIID